jgi:hypothetical protein
MTTNFDNTHEGYRNASGASTSMGPPISFGRTSHAGFIFHRNLLATANTLYLDPYSLLFDETRRATATGNSEALPFLIGLPPTGLLLELSVLWSSDASGDTLSTTPEVRVFGQVALDGRGPASLANPGWASGPNFSLAAPWDAKGLWNPLLTTASTPSAQVTFAAADAWNYETSGGVYWHRTAPTNVYLAGAQHVTALVETAADITGGAGTPTRQAFLLGRVIDA